MFNKAQLVERGRHYFNDPKISKMYATSDGNFFYEQDKNYADSHAKSLKTDLIEITRDDLKEESKKPKAQVSSSVDPTDNGLSFDELKAQAKKLKIKGWAIMKEETLKQKITDANGTT